MCVLGARDGGGGLRGESRVAAVRGVTCSGKETRALETGGGRPLLPRRGGRQEPAPPHTGQAGRRQEEQRAEPPSGEGGRKAKRS